MFYELSPPARKKNRNLPVLTGLDKHTMRVCRCLKWLQENASIYDLLFLFRKVRKRYSAFELLSPLKEKCISSKRKNAKEKAASEGSNFHHGQ